MLDFIQRLLISVGLPKEESSSDIDSSDMSSDNDFEYRYRPKARFLLF